MPKRTRKSVSSKPHPDFPLFPPATGRSAKKVQGRFCYFGKAANGPDRQAALALWLGQKHDLLAGRTPRAKPEGMGPSAIVERFSLDRPIYLPTAGDARLPHPGPRPSRYRRPHSPDAPRFVQSATAGPDTCHAE